MINGHKTLIDNLVNAQDAGGYTLPRPILTAHATHARLAGVTLDAPPWPDLDALASRLVSAAEAGQPIDPMAAADELAAHQTNTDAHNAAQQVLVAALEQAQHELLLAVQENADAIIVDHLRPAHEKLMTEAAKHAANLGDAPLELHSLVTASAKVRTAYTALGQLAAQYDALHTARRWVNTIAGRRPVDDTAEQYAFLRSPRALFPGLHETAALPRDWGLPTEPVQRMLWFVREAQPAQPWLPTVTDQDARWQEMHGEAVKRMRAGRQLAAAVGGINS